MRDGGARMPGLGTDQRGRHAAEPDEGASHVRGLGRRGGVVPAGTGDRAVILYDWIIEPFADFAFMRRALVASLALAMGCGPVGVLLVLRRMSLIGDAMSHAVLPGAALGFVIAG